MQMIQNETQLFVKTVKLHRNNDGFVLVLTMVILVVLSILGLSATRLSRVELIVSGNDRIHKETFYAADGGTELGYSLAYQNAICSRTSTGFSENYYGNTVTKIGNNVIITDKDFAENTETTVPTIDPTDANRHIAYYPNVVLDPGPPGENYADHDTEPHTNVLVRGKTGMNYGFGLQMVSGYEGSLGVGAAKGGTSIDYTVGSRHFGARNSQSLVQIQWKANVAILNSATSSDCKY